MPQLFPKQSNWIMRSLFFGGPIFLILLLSAAEALDRSEFITDQNRVVPQPIAFSHKHHAGQMHISCLYCHNQSEKSRFAQIPAAAVCAGCHKEIWSQSPTLQPVLESDRTGQPILWNKVTKIPAYVYFDHQIHIQQLVGAQSAAQASALAVEHHSHSGPSSGPNSEPSAEPNSEPSALSTLDAQENQLRHTCTLCHGAVETMPLTRLTHPMTMEFCINCHRNPVRYLEQHLPARVDASSVSPGHDHTPSSSLNEVHLESKMDCVTCHR